MDVRAPHEETQGAADPNYIVPHQPAISVSFHPSNLPYAKNQVRFPW